MQEMQQQMTEAGLSIDLQELYNQSQEIYAQAMDCALGAQKASLDATVRLQADLVNSCNLTQMDSSWTTNNWTEAVSKFLAAILEWQMKMLSLMAPSGRVLELHTKLQHTAEDLEHHMDLSTGQKKANRKLPAVS
jgi:hypothetical protein